MKVETSRVPGGGCSIEIRRDAIAVVIRKGLAKEFAMMLAESFLTKEIFGFFYVWQIIPIVLLGALIFFWKMYRNKQL